MEELNTPIFLLGLMSPILVIVCSMCWYAGKVWAMQLLFRPRNITKEAVSK